MTGHQFKMTLSQFVNESQLAPNGRESIFKYPFSFSPLYLIVLLEIVLHLAFDFGTFRGGSVCRDWRIFALIRT